MVLFRVLVLLTFFLFANYISQASAGSCSFVSQPGNLNVTCDVTGTDDYTFTDPLSFIGGGMTINLSGTNSNAYSIIFDEFILSTSARNTFTVRELGSNNSYSTNIELPVFILKGVEFVANLQLSNIDGQAGLFKLPAGLLFNRNWKMSFIGTNSSKYNMVELAYGEQTTFFIDYYFQNVQVQFNQNLGKLTGFSASGAVFPNIYYVDALNDISLTNTEILDGSHLTSAAGITLNATQITGVDTIGTINTNLSLLLGSKITAATNLYASTLSMDGSSVIDSANNISLGGLNMLGGSQIRDSGNISAAGNINLSTGTSITSSGNISVVGNLDFTSGYMDHVGDVTVGNMSLMTGSYISNAGKVNVQGALTMSNGVYLKDITSLSVVGDATFSYGVQVANVGDVLFSNQLNLSSGAYINDVEKISVVGDVVIFNTSYFSNVGDITTNNMTLTAQSYIANALNVSVRDLSLANSSITNITGLTIAGDTNLSDSAKLEGVGVIVGSGNLTMSNGSSIDGTVSGAANITFNNTSLTNSSITNALNVSVRDLSLANSSITNITGLTIAGDTNLSDSAKLEGVGVIVGSGNLTMSNGSSIDGTVSGAANITFNNTSLTNSSITNALNVSVRDLSLTNSSIISIANLSASGNVSLLNASKLQDTGDISFVSNLTMSNGSSIDGAGNVTANIISLSGSSIANTLLVFANQIDLASSSFNTLGDISVTGDLTMASGAVIDASGSITAKNLIMTASTVSNSRNIFVNKLDLTGATITKGGNLAILEDIKLSDTSTINEVGNITANNLSMTGSSLSDAQNVYINSASLTNSTIDNSVNFNVSYNVDMSGSILKNVPILFIGGNANITGASHITDSGSVTVVGGLTLSSASTIDKVGDITAVSMVLTDSNISNSGKISVNSLNLSGSGINTSTSLSVASDSVLNHASLVSVGDISMTGNLNMSNSSLINGAGNISSNNMSLTGSSISDSQNISTNSMSMTGSNINIAGLSVNGSISIANTSAIIASGNISSTGDLTLSNLSSISGEGSITAHNISLNGAILSDSQSVSTSNLSMINSGINNVAALAIGGNLVLDNSTITNSGDITVVGSLNISNASSITEAGNISSSNLYLTGASISNAQGISVSNLNLLNSTLSNIANFNVSTTTNVLDSTISGGDMLISGDLSLVNSTISSNSFTYTALNENSLFNLILDASKTNTKISNGLIYAQEDIAIDNSVTLDMFLNSTHLVDFKTGKSFLLLNSENGTVAYNPAQINFNSAVIELNLVLSEDLKSLYANFIRSKSYCDIINCAAEDRLNDHYNFEIGTAALLDDVIDMGNFSSANILSIITAIDNSGQGDFLENISTLRPISNDTFFMNSFINESVINDFMANNLYAYRAAKQLSKEPQRAGTEKVAEVSQDYVLDLDMIYNQGEISDNINYKETSTDAMGLLISGIMHDKYTANLALMTGKLENHLYESQYMSIMTNLGYFLESKYVDTLFTTGYAVSNYDNKKYTFIESEATSNPFMQSAYLGAELSKGFQYKVFVPIVITPKTSYRTNFMSLEHYAEEGTGYLFDINKSHSINNIAGVSTRIDILPFKNTVLFTEVGASYLLMVSDGTVVMPFEISADRFIFENNTFTGLNTKVDTGLRVELVNNVVLNVVYSFKEFLGLKEANTIHKNENYEPKAFNHSVVVSANWIIK